MERTTHAAKRAEMEAANRPPIDELAGVRMFKGKDANPINFDDNDDDD